MEIQEPAPVQGALNVSSHRLSTSRSNTELNNRPVPNNLLRMKTNRPTEMLQPLRKPFHHKFLMKDV